MTYKGKYIDTTAGPEGWGRQWKNIDRRTFEGVVKSLEKLTRKKLIEFCKLPQIHLVFSDQNWEETTPEEQIISALLIDYSPEVLIPAIKKFSE